MIRPLWIEVDLKALRKNISAIRRCTGDKIKIMATIKQSAYGHGLLPVARELSTQGIDFFGVGSIEEAIDLREDGFEGSPLVLSAVLPAYAGFFGQYNIIPTVVDFAFARRLNREAKKQGKRIPVHVKIDTGMGRLGLYYKNAQAFIKQVHSLENLVLEGVYTHFPVADTDPDFTNYQISSFNRFLQDLKREHIAIRFFHCANSVGIIRYPAAHFNMVRPGIILYGIQPSAISEADVVPVLSLRSKIIFIKRISKGMSVSYGRTYIADRARYIGTVSVGYADGYPWALSNQARVIIGNRFYNVVGRVCMDHIMVDLKDDSTRSVGEEVILIGQKANLQVTVEELAKLSGTIPYEIVSRLSLKIPRLYKNSLVKR